MKLTVSETIELEFIFDKDTVICMNENCIFNPAVISVTYEDNSKYDYCIKHIPSKIKRLLPIGNCDQKQITEV